MRKRWFIFLGFSILLLLPGLAVSDCMDLGRTTGWYVQGENTVVSYSQNVPVAKIVLQDCTVSSSSSIRLTKSYMCDEDSLIIDGQECAIMSLISASGGSI